MKKSAFFDHQNSANSNPHSNTNSTHPTTIPPVNAIHPSQMPPSYSIQQQQQYYAAAYAAQHQYRLQQQSSRQHKSSQSRNTNTTNMKGHKDVTPTNPSTVYPHPPPRYLVNVMGNGNINGGTHPYYPPPHLVMQHPNHIMHPPQQPSVDTHSHSACPTDADTVSQANSHTQSAHKIMEYDEIISEMRPDDLMEFEQEWTHDFPKQNWVEATHWFEQAKSVWKMVDEERGKRLEYNTQTHTNGYNHYNTNDNESKTNDHLDTPEYKDEGSDNQKRKSKSKKQKKGKSKKKKKKKSKTSTKSSKKSKKKKKKSKKVSSVSSASSSSTTKHTKKKKKSKSKKKKKKKSKKSKKKSKKHTNDSEDRKKPKVMWVYRKIVEPMIDDIYSEVLPCPIRQDEFRRLKPDHLLPNAMDTKPPTPTWLNTIGYREISSDTDDSNHNHKNDTTNSLPPKREKVLHDAWIGNALMVYDFLFRFKKLLQMDDKFTISEWIDCIRRNHETYLMNYVLSIFVNVIMDKSELKSKKDKTDLLNGYKCSLLTWPSLLKDFLKIRKRSLKEKDRMKDIAFNDISEVLGRNNPNVIEDETLVLSTPFFHEVTCDRKIELLSMIMQYTVSETNLFKTHFKKLTEEADKSRQKYLKIRSEECKNIRDEVKSDDKVMRGLHRAIPIHWSDFLLICNAHQRGTQMDEEFMKSFYGKMFHSMSLDKDDPDLERFKTQLDVLIELRNELEANNELPECPVPQNLSKSDPKTKAIKDKWRSKVNINIEKIFAKYINKFVIVPTKKQFESSRLSILKTMIPAYKQTNAVSLGMDRYKNRYWILANDYSKIIVESIDDGEWGYLDDNKQIEALLEFVNDKGKNEATLKLNLMERGITYRVDRTVDTQWDLTPWIVDNRNSLWISYPNWRHVLRYQIQHTNFYQYISKHRPKLIEYERIMEQRNEAQLNANNTNHTFNNDNVPFQVSVIKHFLLDLQWALHIGCSEESLTARQIFRQNVSNEFIDIHKLAGYVWKLFQSIDVAWRKKWLNPKSLRTKLMQNDKAHPRTYCGIMLCLYVIDAAVFYDENEYFKQHKNASNKRLKLKQRLAKLQSEFNEPNTDDTQHTKSQLLATVNMNRRRRSKSNKNKKSGKKASATAPKSPKKEKTPPPFVVDDTESEPESESSSETESEDSISSNSSSYSNHNEPESDSHSSSNGCSSAADEQVMINQDVEEEEDEDNPDQIVEEPPRKKRKLKQTKPPPKSTTITTTKKAVNGEKELTPAIAGAKKKKTKRYTGVRARNNLTLICVICVKKCDQDEIIKCSSCHSGYHTYCMDDTSYDPNQDDEEFFCQRCIGAQMSCLHTRRSRRLQNKSPAKADTNNVKVKATRKLKLRRPNREEKESSDDNDVTSGSETEEDDDDEEEDETDKSTSPKSDNVQINRKRKRQRNNRFEDSSSSEDEDDHPNVINKCEEDIIVDGPCTKKRKLRSRKVIITKKLTNGESVNGSKDDQTNNSKFKPPKAAGAIHKEVDSLCRIPKRKTPPNRDHDTILHHNKFNSLPKFNINSNILVPPPPQQPKPPPPQHRQSNETHSKSALNHHNSRSSSSTSRSHKKYEPYSRHHDHKKYSGYNDGDYRRYSTRNIDKKYKTDYRTHTKYRERNNDRDRDRNTHRGHHSNRDRDRDRDRDRERDRPTRDRERNRDRDRERDCRDNRNRERDRDRNRDRNRNYERRITRNYFASSNNSNNNNKLGGNSNSRRSRHRKSNNNHYNYSSDDNDDANDSDYHP
eukprot:189490_1